jgi:8-oxo-dGTP diphosphatase
MEKGLERPKVGTGLMIKRGREVLLGLRKNSMGAGEWTFPGGHLENFELIEDCVRREAMEECGVKVKNVKFQCIANIKKYQKHYLMVGFVSDWKANEPQLLEPEKFEKWQWFNINKLPKNLFGGTSYILKSYKKGKIYFDGKSI